MKNNPHPTTNCNLSATIPNKKSFFYTHWNQKQEKCFCFDRGSKRQLLQENKTESEKKNLAKKIQMKYTQK